MRAHVTFSYEFLQRIPWSADLARVPDWAWKHHEKLDGSGYPRGIRAPDIPLPVRILQIADIFDAMTAVDRSYRDASPIEATVAVLRKEATTGQLDAALVELFVSTVVPQIEAERRSGKD
jgi:HD-GYP domain-containing protein (c-di-GMP phosphodiesterase class II)